jgi:hypothetical protein
MIPDVMVPLVELPAVMKTAPLPGITMLPVVILPLAPVALSDTYPPGQLIGALIVILPPDPEPVPLAERLKPVPDKFEIEEALIMIDPPSKFEPTALTEIEKGLNRISPVETIEILPPLPPPPAVGATSNVPTLVKFNAPDRLIEIEPACPPGIFERIVPLFAKTPIFMAIGPITLISCPLVTVRVATLMFTVPDDPTVILGEEANVRTPEAPKVTLFAPPPDNVIAPLPLYVMLEPLAWKVTVAPETDDVILPPTIGFPVNVIEGAVNWAVTPVGRLNPVNPPTGMFAAPYWREPEVAFPETSSTKVCEPYLTWTNVINSAGVIAIELKTSFELPPSTILTATVPPPKLPLATVLGKDRELIEILPALMSPSDPPLVGVWPITNAGPVKYCGPVRLAWIDRTEFE